MSSNINSFNSTNQSLNTSIEIALDKVSYVDYTDNLDHFTILQTTENKITGLFESFLDGELIVPSPSLDWSKKGRLIKTSITISVDNWTTSYTEQLFEGSTSKQNSVPTFNVKLNATSLNSDFLDKKVQRQIFIDEDVSNIMQSLLEQVGVIPANIDIDLTGVILPAYVVNDNQPIRFFLEDLAKVNLSLIGFENDGVFRSKSLAKLSLSGSAITPDVSITLDQIINFENRKISSNFYSNAIKIKGYQIKQIGYSKLINSIIQDTAQILYFNDNLEGYEIQPGKKLYFTLDLGKILPVEILPLIFIRDYSSAIRPPIGIGGNLNPRFSYCAFYLEEDGINLDSSNIVIESQSIAEDEGKDKLFIIFRNDSSDIKYLKSLQIYGRGAEIVDAIKVQDQSDFLLEEDGQEELIEIESYGIQDVQVANEISSVISYNFWNYADIYTFEMLGNPAVKIGTVLEFQDINEVTKTGVVYEVDSVVDPKNEGYRQSVTVKTIEDITNGLGFFGLDDTNIGLDDAINYPLF